MWWVWVATGWIESLRGHFLGCVPPLFVLPCFGGEGGFKLDIIHSADVFLESRYCQQAYLAAELRLNIQYAAGFKVKSM